VLTENLCRDLSDARAVAVWMRVGSSTADTPYSRQPLIRFVYPLLLYPDMEFAIPQHCSAAAQVPMCGPVTFATASWFDFHLLRDGKLGCSALYAGEPFNECSATSAPRQRYG
jgi:hypothetical protein